MSAEVVQGIIRRAVSDAEFRSALASNSSAALADFDLTAEERAQLSKLDSSIFDGNPSDLEDRLSRGGLWVPN